VTKAPARDPEAEYYQTVEEYFVSRRGDPLILSNAEWSLVRKWRLRGTPLRVVLRGIRDALDTHAHGWSRDRPVRSLSYCAPEVEAARERWERALALGPEGGLDAAGALLGFADALEHATTLGPAARRAADEAAHELRERARGGRLEDLTRRLGELEKALLLAIRKDLGTGAEEEIAEELRRSLEPYHDRMPARVLDLLREESLARRLLEAHGLPRLSLFHLDAGGTE